MGHLIAVPIQPANKSNAPSFDAIVKKLNDEIRDWAFRVDERNGDLFVLCHDESEFLEIAGRIQTEGGCKLYSAPPIANYLESISSSAHRVKESHGRGQVAKLAISVSPAQRGSQVAFANLIKGCQTSKEQLAAIEAAIRQRALEGPVAGFPLVDLEVNLLEEDAIPRLQSGTNWISRMAAQVFYDAILAADPVILEPIADCKVTASPEIIQAMSTALREGRGTIHSATPQRLSFTSPVAEIVQLQSQRTIRQGTGYTFDWQLNRYEVAPPAVGIWLKRMRCKWFG